jgi:hypothetical protein
MGTKLIQAVIVLAAICRAGIALGGATWVAQPYSLSIPAHITGINQSISASTNITLQHDVACDIVVSVAVAGNEVLSTGGSSLPTAYKLTGTNVSNPDGAWVDSTTFITRTYHVAGTGPADTITLSVQATPPANQAPEPGVYTANIILTATW